MGLRLSVLSLQSFAAKHPDVKSQHIIALLAMRGDLNRSAVNKVSLLNTKATEILAGASFPVLCSQLLWLSAKSWE